MPLFAGLSKDKILQLARAAKVAQLPAGEVICTEGDVAEEIFAVVTGTVKSWKARAAPGSTRARRDAASARSWPRHAAVARRRSHVQRSVPVHPCVCCSQSGSSLQFESKAPECFGEASLHFEDELRVRQASVWSDGATVASWQVAHIEALIGFDLLPEAHRVLRRKLLGLVSCGEESITSGLERSEVDLLVEAVEECAYQKGQVVAAAASGRRRR